MATESHIYGIIMTEDGHEVFIKNYYSNGKTIKFTLSNNIDDNVGFSGRKHSKMAMRKPNYTPLMNIRNILRYTKQTKYLKYKTILVNEVFLNSDFINTYELPTRDYTYKSIKKGTHISIIDEINGNELNFNYKTKNNEN
jgi:hypothetical protein